MIKKGDVDEGEKRLKELLDGSYSKKDSLWVLTHVCYRNKVKLKEAQKWAERILELVEEDYPARNMYLNLYANLLFENGEIEKAIKIGTEVYEESNYLRYKDDLERYKLALK